MVPAIGIIVGIYAFIRLRETLTGAENLWFSRGAMGLAEALPFCAMLVVAFLAVDAGSPSSILLNTLTVIFASVLLGMLALVVLRAGSTLISEHLGSRAENQRLQNELARVIDLNSQLRDERDALNEKVRILNDALSAAVANEAANGSSGLGRITDWLLGLAGCEKKPIASEIRHPYYAESLGKAVLK
jgi:hypothetical protein